MSNTLLQRRPPVVRHRSAAPPDDPLVRRIKTFLFTCGLPCLDSLEIRADGGVVRLQGRFPSARLRDQYVSCCRRVAGVIDVVESIEVSGLVRLSNGQPLDPQPVTGW